MDIYDEVQEEMEQKAAPKPAPKKADPKPEPEPEPTELEKQLGWTPDEVARVRRDIHRMWNPEPEETR